MSGKPVKGADDDSITARVPTETPPETLSRCDELEAAFRELKTDMMTEIAEIERKLVVPAKVARDYLKPMQKSIKRREDRKVWLFT